VGIGDDLLRVLHRLDAQAVDLRLHTAAQAFRVDVRLADQPGRLLLGDPERVLELGAQTAVGGASGLFDLRLEVLHGRIQPLELLGGFRLVLVGLDQLAPQVLDGAVHLVAVVPAHGSGEGLVVGSHGVSSCVCGRTPGDPGRAIRV